jgi:hypothetical protein
MGSLKHFYTRGSLLRAIVMMALLVSVVPVALFAIVSINQNTRSLMLAAQDNLLQNVEGRADQIDAKLINARVSTNIAAAQASTLLQTPLPESEAAQRLAQYAPDERNIFGLDRFYETNPLPAGGARSNVYWNNEQPLSPAVVEQIVRSEGLDTIFASIKESSPNTQWIYFTSVDGMMRLYPWASNDAYPEAWDPRAVIFYTVAEPGANPELAPRWTTPYVDFAGAGWMVTISVPVVDANQQLFGIMSHDITTAQLNSIVAEAAPPGGDSYGFLIDQFGRVIAHPEYLPHDAKKGDESTSNLLALGTPSFRALVERMVAGETDYGYFVDEQNNQQLLAFSTIPETGWSFGMVVPRTTVLASVIETRNEALIIGALMIVVASVVAVLLTRQIYQPIRQLLAGVRELSAERMGEQAPRVEVAAFSELQRLADAFNEMAATIWRRETRLEAKVALFSIEVDTRAQSQQVESIVEGEYFKYLERNAEQLRRSLGSQPISRQAQSNGASAT